MTLENIYLLITRHSPNIIVIVSVCQAKAYIHGHKAKVELFWCIFEHVCQESQGTLFQSQNGKRLINYLSVML